MGGYLFSYISKQSHKAVEFSLKENQICDKAEEKQADRDKRQTEQEVWLR